VTTAREFCPLGKLADYISGAVTSDAALTPDPASTDLLTNKIRDISSEKPTEVGAAPEIASAVSGKTYKFFGNALDVKSLSLTLTGPHTGYDLEIYSRDPTKPSLKFTGPIGLDGLYRKSDPTFAGVIATKGTWLNNHTFLIERFTLGGGFAEQKWTLWFDGEKLNLRRNDRNGREISADGQVGR
jgi:hypothetical protein